MKYFIVFFLFCFSTNAQEYAFKVNPLSLAFQGIEVSIESKAKSKNSAEFVFGYANVKLKDIEGKLKAFAGELRYKFLLSPNASSFDGWYIAPTISIAKGEINYGNSFKSSNDISVYSFGALGGYQYIFQNENNNGFVIDFNFGLINNYPKSQLIDVSEIKGLKPRIGISLGYAF